MIRRAEAEECRCIMASNIDTGHKWDNKDFPERIDLEEWAVLLVDLKILTTTNNQVHIYTFAFKHIDLLLI